MKDNGVTTKTDDNDTKIGDKRTVKSKPIVEIGGDSQCKSTDQPKSR